MKLLILGDIGSSVAFHAGDEAMAEAFVAEVSKRGEVSVTAISGCVEDTRARYGWDAVPRFGFGLIADDRTACEARLVALESAARGKADSLPWDDAAWQVIDAVSGADAVAVTGGGNLNSTWPEHIYERAALGLLAGIFAKPFIVSGQTIGPHLLQRDSELVSQLLHAARSVGVREEASLEFLGRLGGPRPRTSLTIDDATFLAGAVPAWTPPSAPYIVATFAPSAGVLGQELYHDQIVDLLERTVAITDCDVILIPHQGGSVGDSSFADVAFHREIAEAVEGGRVHQAPMMTAPEIAGVTRTASLVLSSRYHPVVFGLSGSVPSVGIGVDAYTSTKIKGAMTNYGLSSLYVGPGAFAQGGAVNAVAEAWTRAGEVKEYLDGVNLLRRGDSDRWWDSVYASLASDSPAVAHNLSGIEPFDDGGAVRHNETLDRWSGQLVNRLATQDLGFSETLRSLATAESRIEDLELQLAAAQASLNDARREGVQLHESAVAAQKLAGDLLAPAVRDIARASALAANDNGKAELAQRLDASERELQNLLATRLFRFSRRPRALYARMRRV